MKRYSGFSFVRNVAAIGALLAMAVGVQGQLVPVYQDDFSTAPLKRDLLSASTSGWKRNTSASTWPKDSKIVVQEEGGKRFATVTAQGDKRFNARVGAKNFPSALPITDTENNYYSVDLRRLSPGSSAKNLKKGMIFYRNGNAHVLSMGTDDAGNFFFTMGDNTVSSDKLSPALVADASRWYRMRVKMQPQSKQARVQVVELVQGKEGDILWDETVSGLTIEPAVDSMELQVQRPGPRENELRSMDFANIMVGSLP